MSDVKNLRPASRIIHAGQRTCPLTGAVATPIYQTSTFAFKDTDEGAARFGGTDPGYKYTRLGNPTVAALEECIAELEGGCGAIAASTGMAAVHTVYFTLLGAGAHVVGTDALYGASRMILEKEYSRFGVTGSFVDTSDVGERREGDAARDEARLPRDAREPDAQALRHRGDREDRPRAAAPSSPSTTPSPRPSSSSPSRSARTSSSTA